MIDIQNLYFGYQTDDRAPLFRAFDWHVARGDDWTLLGPSGCGKTTLLRLLAGLLQPTNGSIHIDGAPLTRPRPKTGLILQNYGLLPWANVWQNVALGMRIRRFYGGDDIHTPPGEDPPSRAEVRETVEGWLERLGLSNLRRQFPGQLSGGQKQRVAIARTLALQPDLLLMDEPFGSLDAPTREGLQDLILSLRREINMTTIIVTHAIDEAAILGQKVMVLGQPPQESPHIVDNPASGALHYRKTSDYTAMRNHLRELLGLAG